MSNTDEIGSGNKLSKWLIILGVIVLIPTLLLTEWSLEFWQRQLQDKADRTWAPDAQLFIARSYGWTLRPEKAAERYEWSATLLSKHGRHAEAGEALYDQAHEIEQLGGVSKWVALPKYEYIATYYRDYPVGARAHGAAVRLKTMSRP